MACTAAENCSVTDVSPDTGQVPNHIRLKESWRVQAADYLVDEEMLQELCPGLGHRLFPHDCCLTSRDGASSVADDAGMYMHQVRHVGTPAPLLAAAVLLLSAASSPPALLRSDVPTF